MNKKINCTELLELYERVGGVLVCNYEKNKAYVENTNLKCDIKPIDYSKFRELSYKYYFFPKKLEYLTYNPKDNDIENTIKWYKSDIYHKDKFLTHDVYGYKLNLLDKIY